MESITLGLWFMELSIFSEVESNLLVQEQLWLDSPQQIIPVGKFLNTNFANRKKRE